MFISLTMKLFQEGGTLLEISIKFLLFLALSSVISIPYFIANRFAEGLYLEFDKKFLYQVTRTKKLKIDLRTIYVIERPTIQLGTNTTNRIIRFRDENGLDHKLRFDINHRRKNFDDFIKLVKSANKKVTVKGFW